MFVNIFCVLVLFRLHFFICGFCLCVLWFTSLSFPLTCFLQNILCSVLLGYFLFLVFVCLYLGLPPSPSHLCFFFIFFVSYFKVIFVFIFGFCLCVYFGLPSSPSHLFCSHNTFDFLKFIYFLIFNYLDTLLCQPHV